MEPNLALFLAKVKSDPALQTQLAGVEASGEEDALTQLAALSEEAGLPVTAEGWREFRQLIQQAKSGELEAAELEQITGGAFSDDLGMFTKAVKDAWYQEIERIFGAPPQKLP